MGKTLLILGAGSDIGQAIGHEFAANGFDIILAGRNIGSLSPLRSDLEIRHKVAVRLTEFDAEDLPSHQDFYSRLSAAPDVVLYTAGYLGNHNDAKAHPIEAERILKVNYLGAVSILAIAANDLESRRTGTIIGISSVAGDRGRQSNYIYGSSKSGFSTFLDGLRHRLAPSNVHVITVKPGFVQTKMTSDLALPKLLTAKPVNLAKAVFSAYRSGRSTIYFLPVWRWIMLFVRILPERIFIRSKL